LSSQAVTAPFLVVRVIKSRRAAAPAEPGIRRQSPPF